MIMICNDYHYTKNNFYYRYHNISRVVATQKRFRQHPAFSLVDKVFRRGLIMSDEKQIMTFQQYFFSFVSFWQKPLLQLANQTIS